MPQSLLQSSHYWNPGPSPSFPIQHVPLFCTLQQTRQANILGTCSPIGWPKGRAHHPMKQRILAQRKIMRRIYTNNAFNMGQTLACISGCSAYSGFCADGGPLQVITCPSPVSRQQQAFPELLTLLHWGSRVTDMSDMMILQAQCPKARRANVPTGFCMNDMGGNDTLSGCVLSPTLS